MVRFNWQSGVFYASGVLLIAATDILITSFGPDGSFSKGWYFQEIEVESDPSHCTVDSTNYKTGGNPDYYQQDTVTFSNEKNITAKGAVLAVNTAAAWEPTSDPTPFSHVEFEWDEKLFSGSYPTHRILVRQGTKYYVGPSATSTLSGSWTHYSNSAVPTQFNEISLSTLAVNTSSHPDFSGEDLTDIEFGYAFIGERTLFTGVEGSVGIDNWEVALYREDPATAHSNPTPARRWIWSARPKRE